MAAKRLSTVGPPTSPVSAASSTTAPASSEIGGAALMVVHSRFEPAATAFMALAAIYLPMIWPVIRSGGPKPLDPETLHNAKPRDNNTELKAL